MCVCLCVCVCVCVRNNENKRSGVLIKREEILVSQMADFQFY